MNRWHHVEVCTDCLQFAANGEVEFETDSEALRFHAAYIAAGSSGDQLEAACPIGDHHDVFTGEHFEGSSFSHEPCDWCRRPLGGMRYCAAIREGE
jgi:hypothetical protein